MRVVGLFISFQKIRAFKAHTFVYNTSQMLSEATIAKKSLGGLQRRANDFTQLRKMDGIHRIYPVKWNCIFPTGTSWIIRIHLFHSFF